MDRHDPQPARMSHSRSLGITVLFPVFSLERGALRYVTATSTRRRVTTCYKGTQRDSQRVESIISMRPPVLVRCARTNTSNEAELRPGSRVARIQPLLRWLFRPPLDTLARASTNPAAQRQMARVLAGAVANDRPASVGFRCVREAACKYSGVATVPPNRRAGLRGRICGPPRGTPGRPRPR